MQCVFDAVIVIIQSKPVSIVYSITATLCQILVLPGYLHYVCRYLQHLFRQHMSTIGITSSFANSLQNIFDMEKVVLRVIILIHLRGFV